MSRTRKRRRNKPSPEPDTMTAVASPTDLKRLAFVESAAVNSVSYVTGTTAFAKACGYYTSAKEINALKVREISGPRTRATRRARAPTRESRATTPETRRRRAPRRPAALARPTRVAASTPRGEFFLVFPPERPRVLRLFFQPGVSRVFPPSPLRARRASASFVRSSQGSITKIEDLIKAYGAPVVSKVQEKYPAYMTTVDAKVDTAVTLLQGIWEEKIAPSAPVAYAKSALAATPEKIEAIEAMREEYFAKIEATLEALKARAVKLPAEITTALKTAIADARAKIDDAKLFEKVQAAYRMVVEYPTVVAVIEKTAPVAAKAVDVAGPYYVKAKTIAEPYVVKGMEIAGPYVAAVKARVLPKTVEQID